MNILKNGYNCLKNEGIILKIKSNEQKYNPWFTHNSPLISNSASVIGPSIDLYKVGRYVSGLPLIGPELVI